METGTSFDDWRGRRDDYVERDPNACECDSGALRLPGKQCCAECAAECDVCGGAS